MKQFSLICAVAILLAACSDHPDKSGAADGNDSASTAPITDPSYNPKVEADSAAKHMNLDSTLQKDSGEKK
ncbi:MAG TPA: hypothetical protein VKA49_12980 [Flavitalea sp.]|nr:hypothetical protein [Flavitalea sp.]